MQWKLPRAYHHYYFMSTDPVHMPISDLIPWVYQYSIILCQRAGNGFCKTWCCGSCSNLFREVMKPVLLFRTTVISIPLWALQKAECSFYCRCHWDGRRGDGRTESCLWTWKCTSGFWFGKALFRGSPVSCGIGRRWYYVDNRPGEHGSHLWRQSVGCTISCYCCSWSSPHEHLFRKCLWDGTSFPGRNEKDR